MFSFKHWDRNHKLNVKEWGKNLNQWKKFPVPVLEGYDFKKWYDRPKNSGHGSSPTPMYQETETGRNHWFMVVVPDFISCWSGTTSLYLKRESLIGYFE